MGTTRVLSQGLSSWGMKLTTHLHLVPRLRISGATLLLPLYAFLAWTGKTLFIYLFISKAQTKSECSTHTGHLDTMNILQLK